ncbi:MAG: exosome complex protein Rrp42 [Nanoarchaeota archaeon]|nr:exosome complex protein Rrp42 [Nanoarchaeota archaeon]
MGRSAEKVIPMTVQHSYITKLLATGKRADGRTVDQFRTVTITPGVAAKAEGTARVWLGKTDVVAGVKMSIGMPFSDKPNDGVLIVGAECSPIASENFESGPPDENSIELARVVDRGIRESKAIDTEKLCITPGEKVWMVNLDLHIFNHDGNLIDACSLAAMAALQTAKLPKYDPKTETLDTMTHTDPLPVKRVPLAVSVAKIGKDLIVDPTADEEAVMDGRLTMTTTEDGNICAMQKGTAPFMFEEIEQAFDITKKKGDELRKALAAALK